MPAEIILTVTKFTRNDSATHPAKNRPDLHCTLKPTLLLPGGNSTNNTNSYQVDSSGQVFVCPPPDVHTIAIKKLGTTDVEFVLTIASEDAAFPILRPTAIVFEQQKFRHPAEAGKALSDPNGKDNFAATPGTAENRVTFVARWKEHGTSRNRNEHHAPLWKFWIRVETNAQNGATLAGWIDPIIENSEDMTP